MLESAEHGPVTAVIRLPIRLCRMNGTFSGWRGMEFSGARRRRGGAYGTAFGGTASTGLWPAVLTANARSPERAPRLPMLPDGTPANALSNGDVWLTETYLI